MAAASDGLCGDEVAVVLYVANLIALMVGVQVRRDFSRALEKLVGNRPKSSGSVPDSLEADTREDQS